MIINQKLTIELKNFLKFKTINGFNTLIKYTKYNGKNIQKGKIVSPKLPGLYVNGIYLYRLKDKNLMITRTIDGNEEKINSIIDFNDNGKINYAIVHMFGSHFDYDHDGSYHLTLINKYNNENIEWDYKKKESEDILTNFLKRNKDRYLEEFGDRNIIYIFQDGKVNEIRYEMGKTTFESILKTDLTGHKTPMKLDLYGYRLGIITKDSNSENSILNEKATLIAGTKVYGDCFLIDDHINLNKNELDDILLLSALSVTPGKNEYGNMNDIHMMNLLKSMGCDVIFVN